MEDFVTYDIAVKLKEKGFREKCFATYLLYSKTLKLNEIDVDKRPTSYKLNITEFRECYNHYVNNNIDAPTISQVLKWLREEKKMHIIIPASSDEDYWWVVRDFNREISEYSDNDFDSYEKAALAGIKYVLDKLI